MKINIKATGIELTPAIYDYVNKRISSIEKYLPGDTSLAIAQVEVGKITKHHKAGDIFRAEVHITGGHDIYTEEETDDLYASIDKVKEEIIQKLVHNKEKHSTLARRGGQMVKDIIKGFRNLGGK